MSFRDDDSGQMLVLTAVCMTMLMGFLALAIDVGMLLHAKRNVQIAADAGAIAGALQEEYGGTPSPRCGGGVSGVHCAVQNAVAANGVPAADVISVNANPTNGYHTGPGYVETIVSVPNPTFFLSAFRGVATPLKVTARAVAGMAPSTTCMYVLDPTDADSLDVQAPISAPGCGIQVNSNSPDASCDQGAAIAAPFLHIAGGQASGGGCQPTTSTQVVSGVVPSGDPLNNLTVINAGTACTPVNTLALGGRNSLVTAATIIPATILNIGGISVSVSCFGDLNIALSALRLGRPGANQLFIFENGLQILGNVTINGTLDIAQGTLAQVGGQLSVNAPADPADPLNGIGIYQPSTNTTPCSVTVRTPCLQIQLVGGSMNGIIYAPTSRVSIQGAGGVGGIVAYQLDVTGPLSLTRNYNLANPTTSPLNKVELVE
jgi:hypothetical protein